MKTMTKRILALLLCLCLLPCAAFAVTDDVYAAAMAAAADDSPVTRSDFELLFHFYADGFPDDGMMHYADWEALVDKISIRGMMDSQNFPRPTNRVYVDGGVYLNDKLTVPFEYDAYSTLRFLKSPALGGENIFFHMDNFFEFMLKPYKYIMLQTQNAALALYPEAWLTLKDMYLTPLKAAIGEGGTRTVSYDDLYALCDELNVMALEDEGNRIYFFATSLMMDLGIQWTAIEKLGTWEMLLDYLDPQKQGMTITADGGNEVWTLGETVVFEKNDAAWKVHLPDPDGYVFTVEGKREEDKATLELLILLEDEEYYRFSGGIDGLPAEGVLEAEGAIWADITGSVLYQDIAPIRLAYAYARSTQSAPYQLDVHLDMLNAQTEKPCLGLSYTAQVQEMTADVLEIKEYENWDDFSCLNEMILKEYIDRFKRSIVFAAAPFALEVPSGVLSDVVAFMEVNGLLGIFGIE